MTLKFIQDLKNEINSLLPDNSVGLITPATMRAVLQDMTDSLYSRAGALWRNDPTAVAQALTATPTNYPAIYDTQRAVDPAVVAATLAAGVVTPAVTGFGSTANISFTVDGANGRIVTAVLAKNGTPIVNSRISVTCSGAGNKESASISIPVVGIAAGDNFTLLLSVDTPASINVWQQTLLISINPTFSAI